MEILKKGRSFQVPALEDVDSEYAELVEKHGQLERSLRELDAERSTLVAELGEARTPTIKPSVAALIGDEPDTSHGKRHRLKEVNSAISDTETAIAIVRQRLAEAKSKASVKVCEASRGEYGRRVAAICKALVAVESARQDYYALRDQFEAEDIAWTRLGPLSLGFLGDRSDGKINYILQEATKSGYYNGKT